MGTRRPLTMSEQTRVRAAVLFRPEVWPFLAKFIDFEKVAGRFPAAGRYVARALVLAPQDTIAQGMAGFHRKAVGDLEGARSIFRSILARHPFDAGALGGLASTLATLGRGEELLQVWRRLSALPNWPVSGLAEVLRRFELSQRSREAHDIARRRVLLAPDHGGVARVLANRHSAHCDPGLIDLWYRRALILDPTDRVTFYAWSSYHGISRDDLDTAIALAEQEPFRQRFQDIGDLFRAYRDGRASGLTDALVRRFRALSHLHEFILGIGTLSTSSEIAAAIDALPRGGAPLPTGIVLERGPTPGEGTVLLASCDLIYHQRFGGDLYRGAIDAGGFALLHLHGVDGPLDDETLIRAAPDNRSGLPLRLTHETRSRDVSVYSSIARYLLLPSLLRLHRRPVLVIDCDATPVSNPGSVVAHLARKNADVGLLVRDRAVPWHRVLAGYALFRPTDGGIAFADTLAAVLTSASRRGMTWGIDQASIVSLLAFRRTRPDGATVANLLEQYEMSELLATMSGYGKWYKEPGS